MWLEDLCSFTEGNNPVKAKGSKVLPQPAVGNAHPVSLSGKQGEGLNLPFGWLVSVRQVINVHKLLTGNGRLEAYQ